MVNVYKHNDLYFIEETVTDTIYPNLTEKEANAVLIGLGRNPKNRLPKTDNWSDYCSMFDKDVMRELNKLKGV